MRGSRNPHRAEWLASYRKRRRQGCRILPDPPERLLSMHHASRLRWLQSYWSLRNLGYEGSKEDFAKADTFSLRIKLLYGVERIRQMAFSPAPWIRLVP